MLSMLSTVSPMKTTTNGSSSKMDATQTYIEIVDRGLSVKLSEDWSFALSPASSITPELRAAIKEHKPQVLCLMVANHMLGTAAEALRLDLNNAPPESSEMRQAYEDGDPDALVEYIQVWKHWDELQEAQGISGGSALVADKWGLILVAPATEDEEK